MLKLRNGLVAHLHKRLERGPVKGLALECGHVTSHDDSVFLSSVDLESFAGCCCRKVLGGTSKGRWGAKLGSQ